MRPCLIVVLALCVGCGGPQRAAPVNPDRAREAVKTALDGWKAGKKPADLAAGSPAITAQDFDWLAGHTLVEYQLVDEGTPLDANLHIKAKLTLRDAKGRTTTKTVTYVVGTDPSLTVFRAME